MTGDQQNMFAIVNVQLYMGLMGNVNLQYIDYDHCHLICIRL